MKYTADDLPRFWRKVAKTSPSECWNWTGSVATRGLPYGHIRLNGETVKAHRLSYLIANGAIPDGAKILHRCDNPRCVNPAHLYAGTQKDNVRDMIDRSRKYPVDGVNNGRAILIPSEVACIRSDFPAVSAKALAKKYGVSVSAIRAVLSGRNWKGV